MSRFPRKSSVLVKTETVPFRTQKASPMIQIARVALSIIHYEYQQSSGNN